MQSANTSATRVIKLVLWILLAGSIVAASKAPCLGESLPLLCFYLCYLASLANKVPVTVCRGDLAESSQLQTQHSYNRAHIVLLVVDAIAVEKRELTLTRRELALATDIIREGRGLLIVLNKLDALPAGQRHEVNWEQHLLALLLVLKEYKHCTCNLFALMWMLIALMWMTGNSEAWQPLTGAAARGARCSMLRNQRIERAWTANSYASSATSFLSLGSASDNCAAE